MATKKQRRAKHLKLKSVSESVKLKADGIHISVTIPWENLKRAGVSPEEASKKFRKKRNTRKKPQEPAAIT
jgi:hypothetical protein